MTILPPLKAEITPIPLTYDELTGLVEDMLNERTYYLSDGVLVAADEIQIHTVTIEGEAYDVQVNLQMDVTEDGVKTGFQVQELSPSLSEKFIELGLTTTELVGDLLKKLTQTQMDTDPELRVLKEGMEAGIVRYESFAQNNPTQLATITEAELNPQITDPNEVGWRNLNGFPKPLDQSVLSKFFLLGGMTVAGEGPENLDPLHGDGNVPDFISEHRTPGGVSGASVGATVTSLGLDAVLRFELASIEFNENEIGKYQIVWQEHGTEGSTDDMRVILVQGTDADSNGNYRVINTGYAENVVLNLDRKETP